MTCGPHDELEARTLAHSFADKLVAATRRSMLKVERVANSHGWDQLPVLFRAEYRADPAAVVLIPSEGLTQCLGQAIERVREVTGQPDVAKAMRVLGDFMEGTMAPMWRDLMEVPRDRDIIDEGELPGFRFYGYAMTNEGWMRRLEDMSPEAEAEYIRRLEAGRRIEQDAERVEVRMLHMACRDGRLWSVKRERGGGPQVTMSVPEGDSGWAGQVVNALGRMVRAVVGNPVPVPEMASTVIRRMQREEGGA